MCVNVYVYILCMHIYTYICGYLMVFHMHLFLFFYIRDQCPQHMEDPLDKILKQYESLSPHNVQNNDKDRRREETNINNYNDTQTSIAQGHTKITHQIITNIQESLRKHQQMDI